MSEAASTGAAADSPGGTKASAPKDRNCPYCGQAFTSSSLGRHLDLYIKEKNPKAPDGIHDVDAIRKMRGSITRRQPRGSLARRDTSTPGTPTASRKSPVFDIGTKMPSIPKEGQFVVDNQLPKYPFQPTWEATGVINDIPARNGELKNSPDDSNGQDSRRLPMQRAPSRPLQKSQLDVRQRLADAMDTARAAELALRELLSSFRAAKQQIDMDSLPFDFDPLSLDFPALTLQCLQAPPTLFSSTPHPTSSSWSIQPPAQKQYEALRAFFQEEFRKWRIACSMATTASNEDLIYPPSNINAPHDVREGVRKAEEAAAALEAQVNEHLQSTYHVWEQLPQQRKTELWGLELARSVGRRQKDVEKLKEVQFTAKQENANLKLQIDQLNRLQHPREFRVVPPATIPIEQSLLTYLGDLAHKGRRGIGLDIEDRHVDLDAMVSRAIDRWKTVIVSTRGPGMAGQRSLEQSTPTPTSLTPTSVTAPPPQIPAQQQQTSMPATSNAQVVQPQSTTAAVTASMVAASHVDVSNDDNSDQDADAEMEDDDNFTPITPVVAKPPQMQQTHQQLEISRTRGHDQRVQMTTDARFTVNGTVPSRGLDAQTMQNMSAAVSIPGRMHGHAIMNNGDYGTIVQGVSGGEPMYMDS
ncbi:uncharacterized protein GGS22DRAFT_155881 [Annulohypoxylon maeteangense]|uniref:uncharacterized protein n=1 Tax=Annulohypoxylon maeteangense TaxID=1927788 RepID=UPI002007F5C5|nr:uncharacterized protein GGS22DRAFT_155881 [Annulohypoxylon maeteangense]KAI0888444.1 hypothetical protein GGS22DRAFT_155881 [Annulohypoxylon maeteangense]